MRKDSPKTLWQDRMLARTMRCRRLLNRGGRSWRSWICSTQKSSNATKNKNPQPSRPKKTQTTRTVSTQGHVLRQDTNSRLIDGAYGYPMIYPMPIYIPYSADPSCEHAHDANAAGGCVAATCCDSASLGACAGGAGTPGCAASCGGKGGAEGGCGG